MHRFDAWHLLTQDSRGFGAPFRVVDEWAKGLGYGCGKEEIEFAPPAEVVDLQPVAGERGKAQRVAHRGEKFGAFGHRGVRWGVRGLVRFVVDVDGDVADRELVFFVETGFEARDDLFGNAVSFGDGEARRDLDVRVDERLVPHPPGAQFVDVDDARRSTNRFGNRGDLLGFERGVDQFGERTIGETHAHRRDEETDDRGGDRFERRGAEQARADADGDDERRRGVRAGVPCGRDEHGCVEFFAAVFEPMVESLFAGKDKQRDDERGVGDGWERFGGLQAVGSGPDETAADSDENDAQREAGERLQPTVTVRVIGVGRCARAATCPGDQRVGGEVGEGMERVGNQAEGVGQKPDDDLYECQRGVRRHRGDTGARDLLVAKVRLGGGGCRTLFWGGTFFPWRGLFFGSRIRGYDRVRHVWRHR